MDSMTINWEEPEDDGGTPITGYWLERKETTGKRWTRVTRDPIRPIGMGESFVVSGLIEGSQYLFRVSAINAAGPGLASPPTDPIFARDPIGELHREITQVCFKYTEQDVNCLSVPSCSPALSTDPEGF